MKYNGYTDENTYYDYYTSNDARVNGQNTYFSALVRSFPNDLFQGLTISCNLEL